MRVNMHILCINKTEWKSPIMDMRLWNRRCQPVGLVNTYSRCVTKGILTYSLLWQIYWVLQKGKQIRGAEPWCSLYWGISTVFIKAWGAHPLLSKSEIFQTLPFFMSVFTCALVSCLWPCSWRILLLCCTCEQLIPVWTTSVNILSEMLKNQDPI